MRIVLGDLDNYESLQVFQIYRRIKVGEVEGGIRKMRRGRSVRPDEIPVKF